MYDVEKSIEKHLKDNKTSKLYSDLNIFWGKDNASKEKQNHPKGINVNADATHHNALYFSKPKSGDDMIVLNLHGKDHLIVKHLAYKTIEFLRTKKRLDLYNYAANEVSGTTLAKSGTVQILPNTIVEEDLSDEKTKSYEINLSFNVMFCYT